MALCDELEAKQTAKAQTKEALNGAALHHVRSATNPAELASATRFYIGQMDTLADVPQAIPPIRETILQLAVQGKLVPQDPNDEPASELLKRITAEKEQLVKDGKIKKPKPLPEIEEDEIPFEIPQNWEWSRLDEITIKLGAGSTPLGGKSVYQNEGIMFLRSQNVYNDGLKLENVALIPQEVHEKMSGTHLETGDVLLNITGASIGRSAVVPESFTEGNVSQHVSIVRLVNKLIKDSIHLWLISPATQKKILDVQVGVSREGLSMKRLKEFCFPCPPRRTAPHRG